MNDGHHAAMLALSDAQLIEAVQLNDAELDELEFQLATLASCLGWTGNPMQQPLQIVAAAVRCIIKGRSPISHAQRTQ